jgi:hypothetical protein
VDGFVIETYGSTETKISEGKVAIPFRFQLVDLLEDGILGRDLLEQMQARICYTSHTLAFTYVGTNIIKHSSTTRRDANLNLSLL